MKYFIFNTLTNRTIVCDSFEDLIRWFAYQNYNQRKNSAFEDLAMNMNDTKSNVHWDYEQSCRVYETTKRNIIVHDSYNRVIDPRDFKQQILNYVYVSNYSYRHHRLKKWETFTFRKDPVPRLFRRGRRHRGSYMRRPHTTQERRLSCDPEIKTYIRPSRNLRNLVDSWDDTPRHLSRSWKKKKIKKQWMKNLPK